MVDGPSQVTFEEPRGHRGLNSILGIWATFWGLAAVAGAIGFLSDVSGGNIGVPIEDLEDTPFDDFLVPGLILLLAVGGSELLAGFALLRRWVLGPELLLLAGAVLVGWIAVQMTMIQFSFLQPLLMVIGVTMMLGGWVARVLRGT
jgi:hypothetical protein